LIDIDGNLEGVDTAVVATGAIYFDVGECVPDPKGPPEWGDPIIYYLWQSGVLTMVHENAWFNCAADLMLDLEIVGDTLRFHERNVNGDFPVPCMCYYELTSIVEGLPPGSYVAEVYNQDYPWEESLLLDRRNIHLPAGDSSMSEFGDSGCLSRGGGRSVVNYEYNGDTLNLQHFDATFNCGAVIEVGFNAVGDTLRFYEINISEEYMACDCSFDVTGRVYNIAPGSYVAEVYARNEPDDPLLLVDRQTIVLE
ncbi:MAG: hypothetical protein OEV80_14120, partial [candidate division Zixibacteria bacterium]|nr:hypothetical protein [candidate division Zixibacteria bacterium]